MTITSTPEPLLLPGQAAAPEGPCDMTGMYVMHHAFRRDLTRFTRATRSTPVGDRPTWKALAHRWSRFAHELHEHHTKEDEAIWPLLHARVAEAADRPARDVLDAMEAEHGALDPLLATVGTATTALADGVAGPQVRDDLVRAFTDLTAILDQHLRHEETDAIPLIQRYITGAEWAHLEATRLRGKPTLPQMLFMLPWAIDDLPEHATARLLASAPAPVRLLVTLAGPSYRRATARAFADLG